MIELKEQIKSLEELKKVNIRNYWLKNIHNLYNKLQKPNPDCDYELSLCEITILVTALKQYKQNFYKGDCKDLTDNLFTSYRAKRKHLKQFIKNQNSKNKKEVQND